MLKRMKAQIFFASIISFAIFYWFINTYSPAPSFLLVTDFLEAKSISGFGTFLGKGQLGAITSSIGIDRLSLSMLFLATISSLAEISEVSLMAINFIFLSLSAYLIIRKTKASLVWLALILLTPSFLQSIALPISTSILALSFAIYVHTQNQKARFVVSLVAIYTSFAAWPLFLMLNLYFFIKQKSKGSFLKLSLMIFIVALLLSNTNNIFEVYFPVLLAKTHGYFIDIHRQADLVGGAPILGKLFYNKYIVIIRFVFEEGMKYLDWDYLVFHTATGKFTNFPPTFAMMSIFELPIILYSLFLLFKKKIHGAGYLLAALFTLAVFKPSDEVLPIYWLSLMFLMIQTWGIIRTKIKLAPALLILILILVSRMVVLNHSARALNVYGTQYRVYEELVGHLKNTDKDVLLTDRIGQPHIYLACLDEISLQDLRDNLEQTARRDSRGLLQPDKIDRYTFSSFVFRRESDEFTGVKDLVLVELEKNFEKTEMGLELNQTLNNEKGEELRLYVLEL